MGQRVRKRVVFRVVGQMQPGHVRGLDDASMKLPQGGKQELAWREVAMRASWMGYWLCKAGHEETGAVLETGGGPLCSSFSLFLFRKASLAFPGQGCVHRGPSCHRPHGGDGWGRHKYGQEVLICPVCSLLLGGWTRSEQEKTAWQAGAG